MRAGRGDNAPLMEGRSAPPSRRLGAGRVSSGKHSARPTPSCLASGDALFMAKVGHWFIGSANKNVGGAK